MGVVHFSLQSTLSWSRNNKKMWAVILAKIHPNNLPKPKKYAAEAEGPYQVVLTDEYVTCIHFLLPPTACNLLKCREKRREDRIDAELDRRRRLWPTPQPRYMLSAVPPDLLRGRRKTILIYPYATFFIRVSCMLTYSRRHPTVARNM